MILLFIALTGIGTFTSGTVSGSGSQLQEFTIFEAVDRNEYLLGAGDILQVVIEGGISEAMVISGLPSISACQVSSDGIMQVSGIGQLNVTGMTIDQAQDALQRLTREYYTGIMVGLSLLQPRTVKVWITGMVANPGQYTLYAINRVSDLVNAAGGMSSYSSRTGWMLMADGDSLMIDLHFDPATGKPVSDPFVDGGASVSFGLVTSPVYVIRPGIRNYTDSYPIPEVEIWESSEGETVEDLLYRIGGITGDVDLSRSTLITSEGSSPIWMREMGFSNSPVHAGDTLRLVVNGNDVYVAGAVHQRGIIAYSPGASVRVYVERAGGKVFNADLGGTTLTRDGGIIVSGGDVLDVEVLPGDVIEVPYSWVTRHSPEIGILATVVGITSTIIYLTR